MNDPARTDPGGPPAEVAPLLALLAMIGRVPTPAPASAPRAIPGAAPPRVHELLPDGQHGPLTGSTVGDFAIGDLIGTGGMGEVYRARQLSVDRLVALKVMPRSALADPVRRQRFANEARAAALLDSPHVVRVHATSQHDDLLAIAMELVEGGSLADLLARRRAAEAPLAPVEAVTLALQAARGLVAVHAQQLVHRDIKPANLLLAGDGTLKLGDFGLVKFLDSEALTLTGATLGTPLYMSPEQGRGKELTPQSDLYSLGVVLYELLTLRVPFEGVSVEEVVFRHNYAEPELPRALNPMVPADLQAVCLKCLQKDPADRFADATTLVADLERIAAGVPPMSALFPPGRIGTGAKAALRRLDGRRWLWPIVAGAASLILAAGWWWWDARKDAVQVLRARLVPLASAEAIPATAAADLAALANFVGAQDPQVAQGSARLAEAGGLRNRITTRLDSAAALGSGEISTLRGDLERLARFAPADPGLPGWRQRVEHESSQISGLIVEVERLLATEGPLSEPLALRLATAERALRERAALSPELARRVLASQETTRQAIAGLAERLAVLAAPHSLPPGVGDDLLRFESLAGAGDPRCLAWRQRYERIRALQSRLAQLGQSSTPYPTAGDDLTALVTLVGADDPDAARWSARLAAIGSLRARLAAELDPIVPIPAGTAQAVQEFAQLVGSDDPDVRRWRDKLARWEELSSRLGRLAVTWSADAAALVEGRRMLAAAVGLVGESDAQVAAWTQRLHDLAGPEAPVWAAEHGRDGHGAWIGIVVGSERQRLRWLPPGIFTMGSPADEPGRSGNETPVQVRLTRGLWMADRECSQAVWQEVMGSNPSRGRDPQRPLEQAARVEIEAFCARLAERLPGAHVRLPTEAEWECAARAGDPGPWGGIPPEQVAGAIVHAGSRLDDPAPVGGRTANALGLHDCLGNVWEWCAGAYGPPYAGNLVVDPPPRAGADGVARGGSWGDRLDSCRSARRIQVDPAIRTPYLGFRFVIEAREAVKLNPAIGSP